MMPVAGERSAEVQARLGSSARAAAAGSTRIPSTPFASARAWMPASLPSSSPEVATISLPQLRCGTPRSRQKSYSARRPATQKRAIRLPAG